MSDETWFSHGQPHIIKAAMQSANARSQTICRERVFPYISSSVEDTSLVSRVAHFNAALPKIATNMCKILLCLLVSTTLANPLPEEQELAMTK